MDTDFEDRNDEHLDALLREAFLCTDASLRGLVECFLGALADGAHEELPTDLRAPILDHLRGCPGCTARVLGACREREFRELVDCYLGELAEERHEAIPEGFRGPLAQHLARCSACTQTVRTARRDLAAAPSPGDQKHEGIRMDRGAAATTAPRGARLFAPGTFGCGGERLAADAPAGPHPGASLPLVVPGIPPLHLEVTFSLDAEHVCFDVRTPSGKQTRDLDGHVLRLEMADRTLRQTVVGGSACFALSDAPLRMEGSWLALERDGEVLEAFPE